MDVTARLPGDRLSNLPEANRNIRELSFALNRINPRRR